MNNVSLIGRLGRDVEITQAGKGIVGKFSLAVADGKEKTYWIDCEAWNKTAELVSQYSGKGLRLGIEGKLIQEVWQDKKDGSTKSRIKVRVSSITIIDFKSNNNSNNNSSYQNSSYNDFDDDFSPADSGRIPF